jgi:hypothetical protein
LSRPPYYTPFLSLDGRPPFSPLPRRERTKVRVKVRVKLEVRVKVKTPHSNSLPQGERGLSSPLTGDLRFLLSLDGRGLR